MAWIKGIYVSDSEERAVKEFLERQGLDENQVFSVQTLLREKIVSHVYFNTTVGAGFALLVVVIGVVAL